MEDGREKWDAVYRKAADPSGAPARVLAENLHLLPAAGRALEIACGLGANALVLARRGLETTAWDISGAAVARVARYAREQGLALRCEARDVVVEPPAPGSWEVIVVSHFLERSLAGALREALCPGGLLFYQTFSRDRATDAGPANEAYRLADNELLKLFAGMRVLVYREEGTIGDLGQGFRDEVLLVAQKR